VTDKQHETTLDVSCYFLVYPCKISAIMRLMEEKNTSQQGSLTLKQLDVLKLLFRFRFGTSDLIARAQGGISTRSMRTRLTALEDKGMVVKKQDGRSKLAGKPAVYRLAAKGRAVLKKDGAKYSEKVLNSIRAHRDNSERFIQQHLTLFALFNVLGDAYGEGLVFLTKSNIATDKFDYLSETRPDAFIHLAENNQYYFLYLLDESSPDFVYVRRIAALFAYEKSGKWQAAVGEKLPVVLLVCSSNRLETTLRKKLAKLADDANSDIRFASTTVEGLFSSTNAWHGEDGGRVELTKI
jgi:DNA-binding HxlR family transcriptional regulator